MDESHYPPHFLQAPTNQTRNNIRTPISQQPATDNHQNLGFRQFSYDQERQRRIWVDQQISSHHQRCRESQKRVLVNDGSNSTPSLPFFTVKSHFSLGEDNVGILEEGDAHLEEEGEGNALVMRGSTEQYVTVPPHSLHNQQDSQIKPSPIWRPHFTEDVEIKEQPRKHNQSKRFKSSKEVVMDENCRPAGGLDQSGYRTSAINKTNQMFDGSVQGLKAFRGTDEREDVSRDFKNVKEGDHKMIYLNPETEYLFTSLVNRLMDRQERFHLRFLETIERLDENRREREEAWRQQELARLDNEAVTKSRDQAMALSRDATIISYLETIIGQSITTLPSRKTHKVVAESTDMKKLPSRKRHEVTESADLKKLPTRKTHEVAEISTVVKKKNMIKIRWPNSEVEDLIRIRVSYEPKFRDPTQKGSLWEEISELMASMGYRRNAQRCREKWENINRYYKKVKENSKVQHYTCPYFPQLDQFYASKSTANGLSSSSSLSTKLQERNLLPFDNVVGIQEWRNWKDDIELNHQIVRGQYDDHEEGGQEEEEDESNAN